MTRNLVGPPVIGNDFIGRKKELEEAWKSLKDGNSILLASPRRVGKSSFARKLLAIAEENGWQGIYMDVQGLRDEPEFGELLIRSLEKIYGNGRLLGKIRQEMRDSLSSLKSLQLSKLQVEFKRSPENFYTKLEKAIESDQKYLIVVDELVLFLQKLSTDTSYERAEDFLNWLRSLRQKMSDRVSWIFCSSISIHNFVSSRGLSYTLNDISSFQLGAMGEQEARLLLTRLNESYNHCIEDNDIDYILQRMEWKLPFFIQQYFMFYSRDSEEYKNRDIADVTDTIFHEMANDRQMLTWSERLSGYGKDAKAAKCLLSYLCIPDHKSSRAHLESVISDQIPSDEDLSERYSTVKQMLEDDGYIIQEPTGEIHFRSPIIQEFWINRYLK